MQIKIFTVPVLDGEKLNEEMNVFLRSKKILDVQGQLVMMQQSAFWSFSVKYIGDSVGSSSVSTEKVKVDYKEVLDEMSFKRFSKMREIRKTLAQSENIPAYAILTDEQMGGLAKIEDLTIGKMKTVKGIGEKTIEKYGQQILTGLKSNATSD